MPTQDTKTLDSQVSPLSPFRHRIFLAIWIASLASNFGGLIQSVGAAWLMTSIGASADLVALVQASITLPIMLFSLAAGAIADNFDRRNLMLASQIFLLVVSIALTLCAYFGLVTPWLLLAFPLPYSFLRHPVSGRDPQKGDNDDRDDEGCGRSGPWWAHVAPAQA